MRRSETIMPPPDSDDIIDSIDEADIHPLKAYGFDSDYMTLVGLGPVRRRKPPEKPQSAGMPQSEPPGPWGSHGNEVDVDVDLDPPVPPSLRRGRLGIWGAAIPLVLVFGGAFVLALRGLAPSGRSAATEVPAVVTTVDNAGVFVRIAEKNVRVSLDGQDRGLAPVLITGLAPGSHSLALNGPDYEPFEQPVTLTANNVSTIAPLLIPRGSEPPAPSPQTSNEPVAVSELPSEPSVSKEKGRSAAPKGTPVSNTRALLAATVAATPAVDAESGATGKLNISADLPSNVVVDGRPLGKAPRRVDLAPGLHTVVFINAKEGRRSVIVNVTAGGETSASMEF